MQDIDPEALTPADMERLRAEFQRMGMSPAQAAEAAAILARLAGRLPCMERAMDRMLADTVDIGATQTRMTITSTAGAVPWARSRPECTGPQAQGSTGRLVIEVMAVFAGHERRLLRKRQREGQAAKRKEGGHIGGVPPFGYRKVGAGRAARLEADPAQQAALVTMRALAAERMASRSIAEAVQERHGLKVSHVTVQKALARPARETM